MEVLERSMGSISRRIEGRYLTFSISHEEYGVEIHRIREIISPVILEVIPGSAAHVRGVLKLRGKIVPVLDLRERFGLKDGRAQGSSCIVTVLAKGWNGPFLLGFLVDGIREVVEVRDEDLEKDLTIEFLMGKATCEERKVLLLDVDKVAEREEIVKYTFGGSHEAL